MLFYDAGMSKNE